MDLRRPFRLMNLHKILTEKLPLEAVYSDSEDDKD